jgi:uncharacterized surface protein with fasciclin (FAS1) repeats
MKTKKLTQIALLITFAAVAPITFAAETAVEKPKTAEDAKAGQAAVTPGSLTTVISDSVTFSTLKKALVATGLDVTLGDKGAFTVFAPTDEAFDKLPAGTLGKLMLPENKEKLRSLLLYHVVAGQVLAADLKDGDVKTMNGEKVKIAVNGKQAQVNDSKVFSADVMANNGVMHSIGTVLIPESMKDFSPLDK